MHGAFSTTANHFVVQSHEAAAKERRHCVLWAQANQECDSGEVGMCGQFSTEQQVFHPAYMYPENRLGIAEAPGALHVL